MILHVARHAPVLVSGLCYGRTDVEVSVPSEVALGTLGEPGTTGTMDAMSAGGFASTSHVWSSPSSRCADLAALLASRADLPARIDARLHEVDFGEWEGKSWTRIEREDGARWQSWMNDWQHGSPPGGETVLHLERRVELWLRELDREHDHLLIAHAGVVRCLHVLLDGSSWSDAMTRAVPHLVWRSFTVPRVYESSALPG